MKQHVCVIGNAVVDGFARVEESLFKMHNLNKADSNYLTHDQFMHFNEDVMIEHFSAGGASANLAWTLSQLDTQVTFFGRVGDDPAGRFFYQEMQEAGVKMPPPDPTARTFQIFVLNTPDGERSFVKPETTAKLTPQWVAGPALEEAEVLVIEGFLLLDQQDAVRTLLAHAKETQKKVVLTLAPPMIIQNSKDMFEEVLLSGVDLLFTDDAEYKALEINVAPEIWSIVNKTPRVITHGPKGAAYVDKTGEETFVPTIRVENPLDVTGAGDNFAAGFLCQWLAGESPEHALKAGHALGYQVIQQTGARLKNQDLVSLVEKINQE